MTAVVLRRCSWLQRAMSSWTRIGPAAPRRAGDKRSSKPTLISQRRQIESVSVQNSRWRGLACEERGLGDSGGFKEKFGIEGGDSLISVAELMLE